MPNKKNPVTLDATCLARALVLTVHVETRRSSTAEAIKLLPNHLKVTEQIHRIKSSFAAFKTHPSAVTSDQKPSTMMPPSTIIERNEAIPESPRPKKRLCMSSCEPPSPPRALRSCDRVNNLLLDNMERFRLPLLSSTENDTLATDCRLAEIPSMGLSLQAHARSKQSGDMLERALQRMKEGALERVPLSSVLVGARRTRKPPTLPGQHSSDCDSPVPSNKDQETPRTPIRQPPRRNNSGFALSA